MTRVFGFVGLLVVLCIGAFIYKQQIEGTAAVGGSKTNPRMTVDVVGVRNDLMAIASAERRHFATDGKYVSLDELIANGDLSMQKPSRGPFNYSTDLSETGFRVVATYSGTEEANVPKTISIDQDMQVSSGN
jgi:hypothetical protein